MFRFLRQFKYIVLLLLVPAVSKGAVTANFTVDHVSGCVPLIVHFTNTSTGATSYTWDFGNSTSSTLANPSGASYLTAGTYTVTLTAINGASSATHTTVINVYPLPTTNFSTTDLAVCPGVSVNFSNTSTAGMPGAMTYSWNFGDGATSTLASPSRPYSIAGDYSITLYATNSGGCTTPLTKTNYVHVFTTPVAGFSSPAPSVCTAPAAIAFNSGSTGTAPLSYVWTFGDGATSTVTAPSHNYTLAGSYNVKLAVTNGNGCKDSLTRSSYVNIGNLGASFSVNPTVCAGVPLVFTNTSPAHLSSFWKFGDGGTTTEENPSYSYGSGGTFTAKLIIFNGSCYDSTTRTVTVYPAPAIGYSASPAQPCAAPVTQTLTATMPAGSTATWTFSGTAAPVTGNPVTRSFPSAQIIGVTLAVTDVHGCHNTFARPDTVNNLALLISATLNEGCIPLSVDFLTYRTSSVTNKITNEDMTYAYPYSVATYSWNFGDGSPLSSSPAPTHVYTTAGSFVVSCTILTTNGCTRTSSYIVKAGTPPTATFIASQTHACPRKSIKFTGIPTSGTVTKYKWEFGDGALAEADSNVAIHNFAAPGVYTAALTAVYNGCPSVLPYKVPITIDSPKSQPAYSYLCTPLNAMIFYDYSIGATSRVWLFGDGDTSILPYPIHFYPSFAAYTVRLATYNSTSGCRDTSAPMSVNFAPVHVNFNALDTTLCPLQMDTIVATPSLGGPINVYRWSVDDTDIGPNYDSLFLSTSIPGYHTVRLITTDFRGCRDTVVKSHYLHVANPRAVCAASVYSGCSSLAVNFTDHSTDDPGVGIVSHQWYFGDGGPTLSGGTTMSHTYVGRGNYYVMKTVTDNFGCTDTRVVDTIKVYKPTAGFYASSTSVCKGTSIHFINTSTDSGATWLFGDGSTSTVTSPYHVYTTAGTYSVRLITNDSHGCYDTLLLTGYISVHSVPVAAFSMSDTFAVCPPLNVTFTNASSGATSYYWKFGNGALSTLPSPSNPYSASGIYTITMAATNAFGCSDTARHTASIFGYTGAFTYGATSGCSPLPIHFNATLGSISSLVWDFSDGYISGSSTSDTISHLYTIPGAYVPKLILTDTTGCTNFSLGTDTIKVNAVDPAFTISPNPACENSAVLFSDVSHSYFTTVTTRSWAFGGTSTGTGPSTSHTYSAAGIYTVALTATNAMGCSGTVAKTVTVNLAPAAIAGNHPLCAGFTTSLSCSSGGGTWSSSSGIIATVSTAGILTGVAPGTAVITYVLPSGCLATTIVTISALPTTITGTLQVCRGLTTTLGNSLTGGTWYSSAPGVASVDAGGIVTGISAGSSVITYTLPTGCQTWSEVTVNPLPGSIMGITEICIGSLVTMSDATPLGTWSSSNLSIATIGTTSGVVTGISNGTATITYKLPTGCITTTVTTVHTEPPAISGTLFLCAGFSANLSNPMPGGIWSCSPPPMVASINPTTGVITGYSAGTVTVSYTVPSGCVATAVATISPLPAPIVGTLEVCAGSVTTLTDPSPSGIWTSSNPAIATVAPDGHVTSLAAGTAIITYAIPTGCINIAMVTVDPVPMAITGGDTVCEGGTITLASTTPGGTWTSANTLVATIGTASGVLTGAMNGSTLISYTLPATGCYVTESITVNPTPTSITGATHVCIGSFATIHCTPSGGVWTSSDPSVATIDAAGTVSGLTGGTVTIMYSLPAGGCSTMENMTVNALPPVHSITGGGNYCAGTGGVDIGLDGSDMGISYTLYSGSSAASASMGTGSALDFGLLTVAGIYTVQSTDTSTGCMRDMTGTATVAITTTVVPTVTLTGRDTVCPGTLTTYTAHPTNGGTAPVYEWSVNGSPVSGGTSYSVTPTNGDVIAVVMTSNAACAVPDTATASLTVTVLPASMPSVAIVVDPNDTVCEFTTTNFTASAAFADTGSYTWFINGVTAGAGPILSYIPNGGDAVHCKVTSSYTCRLADSAMSNVITITAEPKLSPHVTVVATPGLLITEGAMDTLTATVTDAGLHPSYQWYLNSVIVPSATTNTYISQFKDHDSVACQVLTRGACPGESNFDWVVIKVKQSDSGSSNIRLYPNPNNGTFTIKGSLADTTVQSADIEIVHMLGQRLLWGRIEANKGKVNEVIQMPDSAASGMYLLKIIAGQEVDAFHVVLNR